MRPQVIMGKLREDLLSSIDDVDIEQTKLSEHMRLLIQLKVVYIISRRVSSDQSLAKYSNHLLRRTPKNSHLNNPS